MAAEYLKPACDACWRPTTPHRLGPTLLAPPLSKVWQDSHLRAAAAPLSMLAEASSVVIGGSAAASAAFGASGAPATAMT